MFYAFDPLYLVVLIAGAAIAGAAQLWVMSAVRSQMKVPLRANLTGAQVAARVLAASGAGGVRIEMTTGFLSDHYDPRSHTLRLSPQNYQGMSVAAAGISAHEAGHAIQHAQGYWPMQIRQRLVPLANIGTQLGVMMVAIGLMIHALGVAKIGVLIFGGFVVFTLVTLPVEIDASMRAHKALSDSRLLDESELKGVTRVLRAAAATYVASALTAILQLLYFASRVYAGDRRR